MTIYCHNAWGKTSGKVYFFVQNKQNTPVNYRGINLLQVYFTRLHSLAGCAGSANWWVWYPLFLRKKAWIHQVWRRRRCRGCKTVFTTHESAHLPQLFVVNRDDKTEAFDPARLQTDLLACLRGRHNASDEAKELSALITQKVIKKALDGRILPHSISLEAATVLKRFDSQGYLRFVAEHPSLHNLVTF